MKDPGMFIFQALPIYRLRAIARKQIWYEYMAGRFQGVENG